MAVHRRRRKLRVLDFDIETRLVGFHHGGKFKPDGCEPTAIACSWIGSDTVDAWLQPELSVPEMLEEFIPLLLEADMVTGHYIRKFDLPILNAALFEFGMPLLGDVLASDTKLDLAKHAGLSNSQENLAAMLDTVESKYKMSDARWRQATRFTDQGLEGTRRRVIGDVKQHKELREALIAAGALNPAKMWRRA